MARKKDLLKDKLNALNPSIPTNTRGETVNEAKAGAPALKSKPRKKPAAKSKTRIGKTPVNGGSSPRKKQGPVASSKAAPEPLPKEEKKAFAETPFLISSLMQDNLIALNRMREAIIQINNTYFDSCRKYAVICCENIRKSCILFPRFPAGKWPFTF